ncbi:hypothetical protein LTR91_013742 [Friedmanniomyces endolithicus]|uniref:Uncharacterized protein n=1 Tax=Friedmanniomyces endolithicus TaxID=329885 RepID=A0AAN6KD30_9PEZI|nr:hypothetical protein LTR57_012500 [Friedmanniomyces endolithicus]KAK0976276.1 hypothetical protein LTR91_013742 [Friedmanniomyces endolithicus]
MQYSNLDVDEGVNRQGENVTVTLATTKDRTTATNPSAKANSNSICDNKPIPPPSVPGGDNDALPPAPEEVIEIFSKLISGHRHMSILDDLQANSLPSEALEELCDHQQSLATKQGA